MSRARRIVHDTAILSAGNFLGLAISLVGTVAVTRALAPDGRGVYAWLLTVAGIAIHVATLAPAAAIRATTDARDGRVAATLTLLCLGGSLLTLPLAWIAVRDGAIGAAARPLLPIAWAAVPITAIATALGTLVQVHGRPWQIVAVQSVPKVVQTALILVLWPLGMIDLATAVWLYLVAALAGLGLVLVFIGQPGRDFVPSLSLTRDIAALLGAGWVSGLAISCLPRVGLLVLGSQAPVEVTGQYSVAFTLQEATVVLPTAIGAVLISHVRRHGAATRRVQRKTALLVLALMALVCAGSAAIAPAAVPLLFGEAFAPAALLYVELLAGVMLASVYQLCQPLLFKRGRVLHLTAPSLVGLALATGVALATIPGLGVVGAVLSNVAGYAVLAAFSAWAVWRPGLVALRPAAVAG